MCAATIITITSWLFLFSSWLDFQHFTDDATTPFKLQIPFSMETEQSKRDECEKERMFTNKMQFIYLSFFPASFWYYQAIFHSICAIISLSHLVDTHTHNDTTHTSIPYSSIILFPASITNAFCASFSSLLHLTSNEKKFVRRILC